MNLVKSVYHRILVLPGIPFFFQNFRRNCATIFMLHRFRDEDRGVHGLDPEFLRQSLEYLRRNNYQLLSLQEIFSRLRGNGPELKNAVAFTIDDGYIDQAEIGGPIFAKFDCPVSTFLTASFVDGTAWGWWDKIEHIFTSTDRTSLRFRTDDESIQYTFNKTGDRQAALHDVVRRCKVIPDAEKLAAITDLARDAGVDLPAAPPKKYEFMTWDLARTCEKHGMTFGPHTITHPILSQTTPEQAAREIRESWQRLCAEVAHPVPIFCYPNGQWADFGNREIDIIREAGLEGAIVGAPGYADPKLFGQENEGPYRVRRMPFPDRHSELVQYVSGIERCKQLLRSRQ